MEAEFSALFITAPSVGEAKSLARKLLQARVVACVNVVPTVHSLYWWEGKIEEGDEALLILKTRTDRVEELIGKVRQHHPYTVPEVISMGLGKGNPDYLRWVNDEVTAPVG